MALVKVQITVKHTGESVQALFNPEEYTINKDNNFASQAIPGLSGPLLQFVHGNMRTLDMELFFDTWDSPAPAKRDVRELTNRVVRLMDIDPDLHAPPILRVSWASLQLDCVLARVSQKFIMFADDGRPVRARLTTTFNEFIDPEREAKEVNRQTADFSKIHVVTQGETLSGVAAKFYDNPQMWRPIAIANELADPREISPGQALRIPTLPFIDPESGEALR
jgi:LysM repeat protein